MPYLLLTLAALFWGGNYVVGHQDRIHALNQHVTDHVISPPEQGGQRQ